MGSKKLRTEKKLAQQKNIPQKPTSRPRKSSLPAAQPDAPWYTAIYLIIAIFVAMFLFNIMLNTFVTDRFLQSHPEYQGDNEGLKAAVEIYMKQSRWYISLQNLIYNFSGIIAMMIFFGRFEKRDLSIIGLNNNGKKGMDIGMGILFAVGAVLIAYNLFTIMGYITPTGAFAFDWHQLLWTGEILLMCIFEEGFFRGYLGYKLQKYGRNIAIIVPAVIFTLYKSIPSTMPGTYLTYLVMGLMLSYTVTKLKTLWFAFSFRIAWTFFSGIVLSIYSGLIKGIVENSGVAENIISGGIVGFENGIIATTVLVICFVLAIKMTAKRNKKLQRKLHSDGTIRY